MGFGLMLAALPAGAELHKCKDKSGSVIYQEQPCEKGTAAGSVKGAGRAAPSAPKAEGLGLWETTTVMRPYDKALPREHWDAAGMNAFFLGRPMKTVSCSDHPVWIVFFDCEQQVASGGGNCRVTENRGGGGPIQQIVKVITGDFRTRFHVEQRLSVDLEPNKTTSSETISDYRYLGACKPGMERHTTFHVKDNGEWVTEKQLSQELEARAQEFDRKQKQQRYDEILKEK